MMDQRFVSGADLPALLRVEQTHPVGGRNLSVCGAPTALLRPLVAGDGITNMAYHLVQTAAPAAKPEFLRLYIAKNK